MDQGSVPEYTLDIFSDRSSVKDIVKAVLHLIFFHRYFTPLTPATHELLDLTLPYVSDVQVETQIEERATALQRQFDISSGAQGQRLDGGRGQVVVNFLERRRKKGWFGACADDDQIWETWILQVNVASPRSEPEASKARQAMESCLERVAFTVVEIVNRERNHIPPIVTNDANPFPHQIIIKPMP